MIGMLISLTMGVALVIGFTVLWMMRARDLNARKPKRYFIADKKKLHLITHEYTQSSDGEPLQVVDFESE